ncbi:hypothetical protein [Brevibacillus laterosporus]|uniref:hypothetical protein n=1 Tax=Brevibacillus laterosporus TaxID=1465 RepID=UPI00215BE319|nr:hypothetical protein [Brevibacillus laterosporus]MCR8994626.1 hypothetical protein [Brevibacillus laterosporus]
MDVGLKSGEDGKGEYHIHTAEQTMRLYRDYDKDFGRIEEGVELLSGCVRHDNDNHYHYFPVNHPRTTLKTVHRILVM